MKKLNIFLLFLIIGFTTIAQQVPNGNFENWTAASTYDDPTGWDTPNSTSSTLGVITVYQESTYVQNGNFAAKLQSKSILGTPIPGLITLGDFDINIMTFEATITGGVPFIHKPEALHGYFQYEPVANDQAFVGVILLKQNGSNWDTIADGSFTSNATVLTWTNFTATLTYRSTDTPTHLNIIIMSSDRVAPQPNSTFYVDNLTFTYPASVEEIEKPELNSWVSDGFLNIYSVNQNHSISTVDIYDMQGRSLQSMDFFNEQSSFVRFPVFNLPTGILFVRVVFTHGEIVTSKVLINE